MKQRAEFIFTSRIFRFYSIENNNILQTGAMWIIKILNKPVSYFYWAVCNSANHTSDSSHVHLSDEDDINVALKYLKMMYEDDNLRYGSLWSCRASV